MDRDALFGFVISSDLILVANLQEKIVMKGFLFTASPFKSYSTTITHAPMCLGFGCCLTESLTQKRKTKTGIMKDRLQSNTWKTFTYSERQTKENHWTISKQHRCCPYAHTHTHIRTQNNNHFAGKLWKSNASPMTHGKRFTKVIINSCNKN